MAAVQNDIPALWSIPLKSRRGCPTFLALSFIAQVIACNGGSTSKVPHDGNAKDADSPRVRSLLQLIASPHAHDGQLVNLGAYVVFDGLHGVGYLEYGIDVEEGTGHIIDSSPIGFQLSSLGCLAGRKDLATLDEDKLRRLFVGHKAAYATVSATFVRDATFFDVGRICDITEMRLIKNAG